MRAYLAILALPLAVAACADIEARTGITQAQQLCLALFEPDPDATVQANARAALLACFAPAEGPVVVSAEAVEAATAAVE